MNFGVHFTTHLAGYAVPELVRLSRKAADAGLEQVWLNDNMRYRHTLVVLSGIAGQAPVSVGVAALVPYFHQPAHLADALGALAELASGREVSVGIGRGDLAQTPNYVEVTRPLSFMRETAVFLRRALAGEAVAFADFPVLADYFHLNPRGRLQLGFTPPPTVRLYGAGNGPKSLALAGRHMDGVLFSGKFLAFLRTGRLTTMVAQAGAERDPAAGKLRLVAELNLSVSRDREAAWRFPRRQVAHSVVGLDETFSPAELDRLGIDPERIGRLRERFAAGATIEDAQSLVDDRMVNAYYLAGTPDEVVPAALDAVIQAAAHGIDQVVFSKLGPDYDEALEIIRQDILPRLT